jgi:hypothetical protein
LTCTRLLLCAEMMERYSFSQWASIELALKVLQLIMIC